MDFLAPIAAESPPTLKLRCAMSGMAACSGKRD